MSRFRRARIQKCPAGPQTADPQADRGVPRHRPARGGRCRLGHRRPAAVAGRDRPAAAAEQHRDRLRPVRADPHARPGIGCALQPGGVHSRLVHGPPRGHRVVDNRAGRLRRRPDPGRDRRIDPRQRHVRCRHRDLGEGARQRRPPRRRGRRHGRARAADLRPGAHPPWRPRRACRRRLHRRRLLVHQLDVVRQPGRHHRADLLRHLRRHRPQLRPGVHSHAAHRRRDRPRPGAGAVPEGRG